MKALRPHPVHAPSLRILLGLDKPPASVMRLITQKPEVEPKKKCWLTDEQKNNFFLVLRDLLLQDLCRHQIIDYLEANDLVPESANGVKLAYDTMENYIQMARRHFNIPLRTKSETVVHAVLQGLSEAEILEKTKYSPGFVRLVFIAMGKKPGLGQARVTRKVEKILAQINQQSQPQLAA